MARSTFVYVTYIRTTPEKVYEAITKGEVTRQGVTQHLDLLEEASLVVTVRRGREKLHFLNPVPLQEIYERWIAKFEKPRLKALHDLKRRLEKAHG